MASNLWMLLLLTGTTQVLDAGPITRACRDTFHSCISWSHSGMCNDVKFGFVMRGGCAKTCGFCKVGDGEVPSFGKHHKDTEAEKKTNAAGVEVTPITIPPTTPATTPTKKGLTPKVVTGLPETPEKDSDSQKRVPGKAIPTTPTVIPTITTTGMSTEKERGSVDSTIVPPPMGQRNYQDDCQDIFPKCQSWMKKHNLCGNPKLTPYLKFGCASTCGFCSKQQHNDEAFTTPMPKVPAVPPGKSGTAIGFDAKNNILEMGIAKEFIQRQKENDYKSQNAVHRSVIKIHPGTSHIRLPKRSGIPVDKKTEHNRKRVEIEAGDDEPSPFKPLRNLNPEAKFLNHPGGDKSLENIASLDNLPGVLKDTKLMDDIDSGKFMTREKTDKKYDYFAEHYSKDPYVAEYQREEWMNENGDLGKTYRRRLKPAHKRN